MIGIECEQPVPAGGIGELSGAANATLEAIVHNPLRHQLADLQTTITTQLTDIESKLQLTGDIMQALANASDQLLALSKTVGECEDRLVSSVAEVQQVKASVANLALENRRHRNRRRERSDSALREAVPIFVKDYWRWRDKTVNQLGIVRHSLDVFSANCAAFYSACAELSTTTATRMPDASFSLWRGHREMFRVVRLVERKLALIGYESEVALSREYFTYLSSQAMKGIEMNRSMETAEMHFTYSVQLTFDTDERCTSGVALNPDRLGTIVSASNSTSVYEIFAELGCHVTSDGVQLAPTRSAEMCKATNSTWIEEVEIASAVNRYLWTETNWVVLKGVVPKGLSGWAPYMEIIGVNVSILSKTTIGRHAVRPLLEKVPQGYDLAVSAPVESVTNMVQSALAEVNGSPEMHPQPYHDGSVRLEGGPGFAPPNIEFCSRRLLEGLGRRHTG
jgi:hypothetical protein